MGAIGQDIIRGDVTCRTHFFWGGGGVGVGGGGGGEEGGGGVQLISFD